LKVKRNLHILVPFGAACVFVTAGLIMSSGAAMAANIPLTGTIFCILGIAGLIWVGGYCLMIIKAVTTVSERLTKNKVFNIKQGGSKIVSELNEAIVRHFGGNISYIKELEEQIQDLQIKIQLLRGQKRNTDAIIYSIRDAVIVIDEFDKLLMSNEAAQKLFGFDFENFKYKPVSEAVDSGKSEFVKFLCQSRQSKSRATKRELEFVEDERAIVVDCIVSCVYDDKDQVCGAVAVLHDITREKEISQMKNDFVSHVSHELKTPLASITAYSEMLVDGEANDDQTRKKFYSVIQSQANRLTRMIENILNTSRIESGLIKVEKQLMSLAILIEEQMQMIKGYAEEKNISVDWGNEGVKANDLIVFGQVYADKDMITQAVVNLLSNAVKYTKAGGSIKIETEVDDTAGVVRFSVTDTGVGIPEDEVGHVFNRFYRVKANKKQAKGTGLGLNLVKQIIEKVHDGNVFVHSKVGAGSTFGFELPLATAEVVEKV